MGVSWDCPIFPVGLSSIISETGNATSFKFCVHTYSFNGSLEQKKTLKISGKVAMGVVRQSRSFAGHQSCFKETLVLGLLIAHQHRTFNLKVETWLFL